MSVLIKGMSIPDNCESCAFETGFGFCLAKSNNYCRYTNARKRPKWCPLVEVPEPHGRLIDADEICFSMTNGIDQAIAEEAIRESTTVIEAEGSNDTRKAKGD